jgi:heme-degrading monooxygenase HmoA
MQTTGPFVEPAVIPIGVANECRNGADPLSDPQLRTGAAPPDARPGFVALSKFVVANDMTAEVKTAFRNRPHLVDEAPGYLRMDVISPCERPEQIWLITFWTDEPSFRSWHHSHLYHASHDAIPRGLKLVPGETDLRCFEHIAS